VAGRYSVSKTIPRLIPITAQPSRCTVSGTSFLRWQLPLAPAHARTIHSAQGVTAHYGAVVDPGSKSFAGDYVAMSRVKKLIDLILLNPVCYDYFNRDPQKRQQIEAEYARLEELFKEANILPEELNTEP
jgi:hypothetical protein